MLTQDGTRRYAIHATPEVEASLNALHDLAVDADAGEYTDTGDLWTVCAALFEAITGGEVLPGFEED